MGERGRVRRQGSKESDVRYIIVETQEKKKRKKKTQSTGTRRKRQVAGKELAVFLHGGLVLLRGTAAALGTIFGAIGESIGATSLWLQKVNKGRWGPTLLQWLVLFALGWGAGILYSWLV